MHEESYSKEIVIDCKFEKAEDDNDGFEVVERTVTDKAEYGARTVIGFIDEKGMMLTDFKCDRAFPFSDEMALVLMLKANFWKPYQGLIQFDFLHYFSVCELKRVITPHT